MEYYQNPPPANATVEDVLKWASQEFQVLEQVIAELNQQLAALKEQ